MVNSESAKFVAFALYVHITCEMSTDTYCFKVKLSLYKQNKTNGNYVLYYTIILKITKAPLFCGASPLFRRFRGLWPSRTKREMFEALMPVTSSSSPTHDIYGNTVIIISVVVSFQRRNNCEHTQCSLWF